MNLFGTKRSCLLPECTEGKLQKRKPQYFNECFSKQEEKRTNLIALFLGAKPVIFSENRKENSGSLTL